MQRPLPTNNIYGNSDHYQCGLRTMATAAKSQKKEAKKITKQYIINQLEENEVDLSMSQLDNVPVKELVRFFKCNPCCSH